MQIQQIKNKAEILLVVCVLALFYLPNLSSVEFHNDESQWIATSNVFEAYIKLDFASPLWKRSYWTLTQPPMARYVIGLSRYIGGYRIPDLNTPWDFNRGVEFNTRQGAMPSDGLLWWSRLPMAILAVVSLSIAFVLLQVAWGRLAAYIWLALVAFNPYFLLHLRRAMGESCLLFFTVLGLYALVQALKAAEKHGGGSQRSVYLWLGAAGIASGLAGASKLNGLAMLLAPILIACVVALKSQYSLGEKLRSALAGGVVASICCIVVFIGINPFLWPNPVGRTVQMFQHRVDEMSQQIITHPVDYVSSWSQRVQIVPARIFADYAALPIPLILNILLFGVGLVLLGLACFKWLRSKGTNFTSLVWLIAAVLMAVPPLFTIIDWDRYYLFPVFFSTAFIAVALAWIARVIFDWMAAKFTARSVA